VRFEHSVTVERPPEDVFAYLAEPANLPEWQASVLEARTDGPVAQGTKLTEVRKFLGTRIESTLEVTAHEPGKLFSLRVTSGPLRLNVEHHLTPAPRGTQIDVALEAEPSGFVTFAEPIVARTIRRELEFDFSTLKDVLEARG
jgi:uncharacterized protein YndB with AHSA1/START domain